ncbi:MAG: M61 family metallopeptidase [Cyclobacteriaceae bacterium]
MRLIHSLICFCLVAIAKGQAPIVYELSFENIVHHELQVKVTFTDIETDVLEIRMPNSSPGRYAVHQFAKNVYLERAKDLNGEEVALRRLTPYTWEAEVKDGSVTFEYTVFGNHADGTYLGVDAKKVHMNMPATFVYGVNLESRPIELFIPERGKWDVATQLDKQSPTKFVAPNYYYFYDSPTIVGEMEWRRWEVDGQTIEMSVMHEGTKEELDAYTAWVKLVVNELKDVYGELPKFDYGRYTFLIAYNPWVKGDGMEHRNSTVCTSTRSLETSALSLIRTISHEFFHSWNVERIRPESLEPFDFDVPNLSEALWFGEGFTDYYDRLTLMRTGIYTTEQFIRDQANRLTAVLNAPGRSIRSAVVMSQQAVFKDAGVSNDATNFENTFISYYQYGSIIALGLDLTLRTEFDTDLDTYMKTVWKKHGKTETPYTMTDLQQILADLTSKKFASSFFKNQIYGSQLPDFTTLFENFGIKKSIQSPDSPYFGNPKLNNYGKITSKLLKGTALYEAGIEQGDKLISIDERELDTTGDLNRIINTLEVGKSYEVEYEQLGERKTGTITTVQDPRITLAYLQDSKLKSKQIKLRNEWLGLDD